MTYKKRTNKTLPNGRSDKKERFVSLPYNMLDSEAYKDLNPKAVCILIELRRRFNGSNNGEISMSCREAGDVLGGSKNTGGEMLKSLEEHGFIKTNEKGHFTYRQATTWILTCEEYQGKNKTNDWKNWRSEKQNKVSVK